MRLLASLSLQCLVFLSSKNIQVCQTGARQNVSETIFLLLTTEHKSTTKMLENL